MYVKMTFEQDFDTLMMHLWSKYGKELFNIDGIGKQMDMNQFRKSFFNEDVEATADISVDANSNVDGKDVITYNTELKKPFSRYNSYYNLWKNLRDLFGMSEANRIIEKQLTGDIYINDFGDINLPYSYHPNTTLIIKQDDNIIYTNMEELFDVYKQHIEVLEDREQIDLSDFDIQILDKYNNFVLLKYILRHKPHCNLIKIESKNGFCTYVTEDHPVICRGFKEKQADTLTVNDYLQESDCLLPMNESQYINPDFAYFIGFIIGDGRINFRIKPEYKNTTEISYKTVQHASIVIYQKDIKNSNIWDLIIKLFGKESITYDYASNRLLINNKDLCIKLHNLGIGTKSQNRKLPTDILNWNVDAIKSLICGIIDSNGTINTKSGIVELKTTSYSLAQQIGELCRALNMERVRTSFIDTNNGKNSYNCEYKLYRISFVCNDYNFTQYSEKINNENIIVFKKCGIGGRWNDSKIHKLINENETPEWVYDITTESGTFHSQGLIQHNCFNYSTYDISLLGLPMIKKINSIQPKYLFSFKSQLEQFITIASNSTLGATGLADVFIVIGYYIDKMFKNGHDSGIFFDGWFSDEEKNKINDLIDKIPNKTETGETDNEIENAIKHINKTLNKKEPANKKWFERNIWKYLKETLVSFIYTINQPMRGNQSPFTNVSIFDTPFLNELTPHYSFDGVTPKNETVIKIQNIFMDIMNEELERTPVTFPVTTACFSISQQKKIQDEEFLQTIAQKNQKFGFINVYCGSTSTLSSCCRLRSDTSNEYFNSFGAGSSKIGSLGVVTMNLPRLAMKYRYNKDEFFQNLSDLVKDCAKINHAKRTIINKHINRGALPLYTLGFMDLKKQYSTAGVTGLNECAEILGYDIVSKDGQEFVLQCLKTINDTNDLMQSIYGFAHNTEQVPAENSSIKLCKKDDYLGYANDYLIYSNQFIPLTTQADLIDRIKLQGIFDQHFSGGAICHINVEHKIEDTEYIAKLIRACAYHGLIYYAINYNLQRCGKIDEEGNVISSNNHMTVGKQDNCSICGDPIVDNFTRVVGFLVNTKNWNKVRRKHDYPHRQFYDASPKDLKNGSEQNNQKVVNLHD